MILSGLSNFHLLLVTGAVLALPEQLLACFTNVGDKTIFNRNTTRCKWAAILDFTYEWKAFFEGKTSTEDGKFMAGFGKNKSPHKDAGESECLFQ